MNKLKEKLRLELESQRAELAEIGIIIKKGEFVNTELEPNDSVIKAILVSEYEQTLRIYNQMKEIDNSVYVLHYRFTHLNEEQVKEEGYYESKELAELSMKKQIEDDKAELEDWRRYKYFISKKEIKGDK